MKTPWEFLQYSRNKIKNTWKIAFVSAFVIGLLIHLPVMLSDIPNHDGLSSMYFDQNMITSGRDHILIKIHAAQSVMIRNIRQHHGKMDQQTDDECRYKCNFPSIFDLIPAILQKFPGCFHVLFSLIQLF